MQTGLWVNQWQPVGEKRIFSILKMGAAGCSKIMERSLQSSCIRSWKTVNSTRNILPKQNQFLATCYIQEQKTIMLHHINIVTVLTWLYNKQNTFIIPQPLFLIIIPTKCTNFSNLLLKWNSTCFRQFPSTSSGVFYCTHSNGICHTGLLTACKQDQDGTQFHPDPVSFQE
jgi:hypothetical protein